MNSKLFLLQEEETESLLNSFSFPTFYFFFYSATLEYYYLILCNSETGQQFEGNLFVDLGTCLLMASFFMEFFLLNFQHLSSSLKCHSLVPQQNKTVNFFLSSICPMIAGVCLQVCFFSSLPNMFASLISFDFINNTLSQCICDNTHFIDEKKKSRIFEKDCKLQHIT